jgi:hypothetical protein
MDKETNAVETTTETAASTVETTPVSSTAVENRIKTLEEENAKLIEEGSNWKLAALKYKGKQEPESQYETDDEKYRRIAREEAERAMVSNKINTNEAEKKRLIEQLVRENKELKLASLSKTNTPPAAVGSTSESRPVRDTLITSEQMTAFKARGWTDKDIERYKKNLQRYSGR